MDYPVDQAQDVGSVRPSLSPLLLLDILGANYTSTSSTSTLLSETALPLLPSASSSLPYPFLSYTFSPNDLADLESQLLWTLHEPSTIALTAMYCASFVLGFVGNLMSLRVLTNRHSRRLAGVSATRNLLVNLAVCDLAVVCVCMPVTLGSQIYKVWVYGDFLCRAVPFTQAISVSASVLTLTVISVNRYFSVRSPLRARSMFTRRRILLTVAVGDQLRDLRHPGVSRGVARAASQAGIQHSTFVMLYCLPVTFNLTIGFLTGRRLWGSRKTTFSDLDPRSQALHDSRLKTRQKIAKMVVCLVLLFAVSWLPLYLADLLIDWEESPPSWILQARPFAQWLGLTNSSLNPICYCFIGDLYRSAKVIRTRYYQKVAALFGSSTFSKSTGVDSPRITDSKRNANELQHVASAAVVSSTSMVTIPRLLSFATGQCVGQRVRDSSLGCGSSDHSISDWCRSCSLFDSSCQLHAQADFGPTRRHSMDERRRSLSSRVESSEMLPLRRHSGERLLVLSEEREVGGLCLVEEQRRSSEHYIVVGESEDTTSL
ncbi:hypothetical protein WMY93_005457 [Mugilogobius chulae]|uniref:G-protein coupled receptors family 1 profile domain-containing protein n=1 Tax=Mugilogobius chulae TaxID=88201 RepID=A0AAW0PH57_9GOBI